MRLRESDLCQRIHKEGLLLKIQGDPGNFGLLAQWSLGTTQPLAWRSTWMLRQESQKNDPRLTPYLGRAIDNFPNFNESQKREWLKILIDQTIHEEQEGILFDQCINEWQKISNHPALRSSAMTLVFRILRSYPELMQEVQHLMQEEYLSALSPGIRRSLEKQWTALQKSSEC